ASEVLEVPRAQPEQPGRLIVRLHLRNHFLYELMLADGDAERLALLRVAHAGVPARANQPRRAGGHGVAPLVEREHRDLEALARPSDDVRVGDFDVLHLEEAGVARENPPLLFQCAARKPLERALDDEGAQTRRYPLFFLCGTD